MLTRSRFITSQNSVISIKNAVLVSYEMGSNKIMIDLHEEYSRCPITVWK